MFSRSSFLMLFCFLEGRTCRIYLSVSFFPYEGCDLHRSGDWEHCSLFLCLVGLFVSEVPGDCRSCPDVNLWKLCKHVGVWLRGRGKEGEILLKSRHNLKILSFNICVQNCPPLETFPGGAHPIGSHSPWNPSYLIWFSSLPSLSHWLASTQCPYTTPIQLDPPAPSWLRPSELCSYSSCSVWPFLSSMMSWAESALDLPVRALISMSSTSFTLLLSLHFHPPSPHWSSKFQKGTMLKTSSSCMEPRAGPTTALSYLPILLADLKHGDRLLNQTPGQCLTSLPALDTFCTS